MSIEAITWALRVPIGGNAKAVLVGLANHAHPDGTEAFPALDTLAVYAYCDRATVRRNLRKLRDLGWIEEDGCGPKGTGKWRLRVDISLEHRRRCVYCGERASVLDHVVPRSRDGSGSVRNLVPACVPCNAEKASRDAREWVESKGWDWSEIERRMLRFWAIDAEGGKMPPVPSRPQQATSKALPRAPVPPEPSLEPSSNRSEERSARAPDPRERPPEDFPDELRPHAREVYRILRAIAEHHGARKVWPLQVGKVLMAHPRHPVVAVAHELDGWAVDPPRPIRDVVGTYRTFLGRRGEMEATERLADDGTPTSAPPGLPPGVSRLRPASAKASRVSGNISAMKQMADELRERGQ